MPTPTTLAAEARFQQEVRKSRFVAQAAPVQDVDAALAFIARVADRSATHNCWAYRIGAQYRFNDDGEPAARPASRSCRRSTDNRSIASPSS